MPSHAARYINPDETMIQGIHAASSILLVEVPHATTRRFECRGCISLDISSTRTFDGFLGATLDHLDEHLKAGDAGAKDAIWKLEACAPCRGAGRLLPPLGTPIICSDCKGSGKNKHGQDRGVRRGVVVG